MRDQADHKPSVAQCLACNFRVSRAIEGSTKSLPLLSGVFTVLPSAAPIESGRWDRGVIHAAVRFVEVVQGQGGRELAIRYAGEEVEGGNKRKAWRRCRYYVGRMQERNGMLLDKGLVRMIC